MASKWTRNQKLILWSIIVSAIIAIGNLYVQLINLEKKILPVIPQIVNVINNITKVEKEIVNLKEFIKEQDRLWKSETFLKKDIGEKVIKINRPENSNETTASFIVIELENMPLRNTVIVSSEMGQFAPNTFAVLNNTLRLKFLNKVSNILDKDTDFINVTYIPDFDNNAELYTVKGMTYEYREHDIQFYFNRK